MATPPAATPLPPLPSIEEPTGWRKQLRQWTKPPRRITFTRAGKFFMLLTLAVGAGALNTGNNLLFLLLGMMLSAIIASGVLSEAALRKLELTRTAPRRIFANRPAPGAFTLENPRRYPSINIEASEQNATQLLGPAVGSRAGKRDVPFYKFWVPDAFEDDCYVAIARVAEVHPQSQQRVEASYLFPQRGVYRSPGIRLATRFPFGIFHKVRDLDAPQDFLVFPTPLPAHAWHAEITANHGEIARNRAGLGQEYFGLRDWRHGEDRRQIHWKSSARRNAFVVREFEEHEQRAVEILFLNSLAGVAAMPPRLARELFEHNLSKLAGLLESLLLQDYRVALRTLHFAVAPGQGPGHLDTLLHHLATLELDEQPTLPPLPQTRAEERAEPHALGVARVALGFEATLAQCAEPLDLSLKLAHSLADPE